MRVVGVVAASDLADEATIRRARDRLRRLGLSRIEAVTDPERAPEDPAVVLIATGGTEDVLEALMERCPALLPLYWPRHNSLAAALEVGLSPVSVENCGAVIEAFRRLVERRVLVLGGKCEWVRSEEPSELPYLNVTAVDVDGLDEVKPAAREVKRLLSSAGVDVRSLDEGFLELAGRLHALAEREKAVVITGDCFGLYEEYGAVPCLYFSARGGYCCEGDATALLTVLACRRQPFVANVVEWEGDRVRLAHCACPLELVEGSEPCDHLETGAPHAVRGCVGPGDFGLARYPDVWRVDVVETSWREDQCRVQAEVRVSGFEPRGNHHCLVGRDEVDALRGLFSSVVLSQPPSAQ
ncbi:MAG: hypothetical protein ABGY09_00230 [Euryarchaeota archaeon]